MRRGPSGLACPTHVLFNGGVLHAGLIRERILGVLNQWLKEEGMQPVEALTCPALFVPGVPGGAVATGPPPAVTPHVPA